jgi:hypothetical protein
MSPRRELLIAACALLVVACSITGGDPESVSTVPATIGGVGVLPPPITQPGSTGPPAPTSTGSTTTTTILPVGDLSVGELAGGNRVLMIGDSLLASVSKRYYNELCETLVPLGWQLQVEAEVSRQIDFARIVLDELGVGETDESSGASGSPPDSSPPDGEQAAAEGWDAGLIFLGTNYNRDALDYLKQLNAAIVRFGDMPIVVVLVTEYDPAMQEVNAVIESVDELYDNVRVVDWRALTALDAPGRDDLLTADGIHLTEEGRQALATVIAAEFGRAPASPGGCLEPVFDVDVEPLPDGSLGSTGVPTTVPPVKPRPKPRPTTTTSTPADTTTTTSPDGGGGDDGGGDGGGGDGGGDAGGGDPGGGG